MECGTELSLSQLRALNVVAVGLVDHNPVGHLHDAALYALQLVAGAGKLNEQEKVDHRMHSRLALAHTHRLHEDVVVAGSLAQHDGLAGLARHTSQRTARRRRAYERRFVLRQLLHSGLVAQDAPLGALRRGVDGQHGQLAAIAQHMEAEHINRCGLARSGYTGDADATTAARMRQTLFNHFLRDCLMRRSHAFNQSDGTGQTHHIALQNPLHQIRGRRQLLTAAGLEVGTDNRGLFHAGIHSKADVFGRVFRMFFQG